MKYRGVAHIATPLHFRYRALYSKSIVPCTLNRKHQEEFICAHTNMRLCHTFSQKIRPNIPRLNIKKERRNKFDTPFVTYCKK